jgi:hypothetical protein
MVIYDHKTFIVQTIVEWFKWNRMVFELLQQERYYKTFYRRYLHFCQKKVKFMRWNHWLENVFFLVYKN